MDSSQIDYSRINNTLGKMYKHLKTHDCICVGVSGGSDSNIIVHIIATYFREFLPKVHFVFSNTGLEYKATLRHLDYMEQRYDIKIDRIRPDKGNGVVSVIRREGVPIVSKEYSRFIHYLRRGSAWAIKKFNTPRSESKYALTPKLKALSRYLVDEDADFPISDMCCNLSKKYPFVHYMKSVGADLKISGERRCEGGIRAMSHSDCFEPAKAGKSGSIDKYMPLFLWNDATKQYYKERESVVYSDCYEVWGMTRTGCVGCPYNSKVGNDLKLIKKYEPKLYKACMNVFGESYRLMDKFNIRRVKILQDEEGDAD